MTSSGNDFWFNNVKKGDTGVKLNIIPSEEGEKIEIHTSSTYETQNIENVTDENPSTKWESHYSKQKLNDGFYIGKEITHGDYSIGTLQESDNLNKLKKYEKMIKDEINKLKLDNIEDFDMNKKDNDFMIKTRIMIGSSRSNVKDTKVSMDAIQPVNSNISNHYRDRFKIWIHESNGNKYLRTKRTDYWGGWGDGGLATDIYIMDHDARKEYKQKRNYILNIQYKIRYLNNKLNNKQKYINDLPINVKNDGKYIGNKKTMLTNGSIINGEWIQLVIPNTLVIKEYKLLPGKRNNNENQLTPFPKDFYLLGSNDATKWDIMDSHFDYNPVYFDINTPITFSIKNSKEYKYVRLVISSLNSANMYFDGLGSVSLSIFNLMGNQCYSLNKSCETFVTYSNRDNMSKVEGLTMMEENINVLDDLKNFNEKYHKYIKCSDTTISEEAKQQCTMEDSSLETVNNAYDKLMKDGSIQKLQNAPLNAFSTVTEYENNHTQIIKKHSEIIPLRNELDSKLKQLMDDENSVNADYKKTYDTTMYSSLVLSVILTSSLFFIFKKL